MAHWFVREPVFLTRVTPPPQPVLDWRYLLGVAPEESRLDEIKRCYRRKAQLLHPDRGGNALAMAELNRAYQMARAELGEG